MKIIYVIPVMFILSGCFYQDVPKFIIDKAEGICKDDGGIANIYPVFNGQYDVRCGNGKFVNMGWK